MRGRFFVGVLVRSIVGKFLEGFNVFHVEALVLLVETPVGRLEGLDERVDGRLGVVGVADVELPEPVVEVFAFEGRKFGDEGSVVVLAEGIDLGQDMSGAAGAQGFVVEVFDVNDEEKKKSGHFGVWAAEGFDHPLEIGLNFAFVAVPGAFGDIEDGGDVFEREFWDAGLDKGFEVLGIGKREAALDVRFEAFF